MTCFSLRNAVYSGTNVQILTHHASVQAQDWGAAAEEEAAKAALEEASGVRKNRTGLLKGVVGVTPVTVESFTAWRRKLEEEEERAKNITQEMREVYYNYLYTKIIEVSILQHLDGGAKISNEQIRRMLRPTGRQLSFGEPDASLC